MPNKKLGLKQFEKLKKVEKLQFENERASAYLLGSLSFQLFGGSYGKTFNPFSEFTTEDKRKRNDSHGDFRNGFNETRKPKVSPI